MFLLFFLPYKIGDYEKTGENLNYAYRIKKDGSTRITLTVEFRIKANAAPHVVNFTNIL